MTPEAKFDEGKQKWSAMPLVLLEPLADAFSYGAFVKYWKFSCITSDFENPDEDFYDAMMRHIKESQVDPLAKDKDSDCYHLAQVAFNALMRLHHCRKQKAAEQAFLEGVPEDEPPKKKEVTHSTNATMVRSMPCINEEEDF